jgi:hypothetical protein
VAGCGRADPDDPDALRRIEELGGRVSRAEDVADRRVVTVDLRSTPTTDADLKRLAGLKDLRELQLNDTHVTDAGLKHLAGLPHLRLLYLAGTPVTDAGLQELLPLQELQELNLGSTRLTARDSSTSPG